MKRYIKSFIIKVLGFFGFSVRRSPPVLAQLRSKFLISIDLDFVIADHLERRESDTALQFLQIGAFDGISNDPIYHYVTNHNWEGVLVEPQSKFFNKLKDTYSDRDSLTFLNVAVSESPGTKILYVLEDPESKDMPPTAGQMASFDLEVLLAHKDEIPEIEDRIRMDEVEGKPLMEIINGNNLHSVELIQIDTEGFDSDIIKMIDFGLVSPSIICFEHKHLEYEEHKSAVKKLTSNDYLVGFQKNDTIAYRRL